MGALVMAQLEYQFTTQQRDTTLSQLLGNPDLPLAEFPEYAQAKAALDNAQRNLGHTVVRAPISGTATQVDNIQVGRFVAAGTPILSVIDDQAPWVDANPKESDITYLARRPAGRRSTSTLPRSHLQGHVGSRQPRHRRAILDPAAAERHRQLGQGGAARAGADRFRQATTDIVRKLKRRHERRTSTSTPAISAARRPARLLASEPRKMTDERPVSPPHPLGAVPACVATW